MSRNAPLQKEEVLRDDQIPFIVSTRKYLLPQSPVFSWECWLFCTILTRVESPATSKIFLTSMLADPETCAQGWRYFDGSCYRIASESLAFASARNVCVAQGADLVKISSSQENTFIRDEASDETWIGLEKAQGGSFYWKDDSAVSYSNWKDGAPGSDTCVVMGVNGTWRDSPCSFTPSKYVCEQGNCENSN